MKIIVAGSKYYNSKKKIYSTIEGAGFDITEIVTGGADGVERMAEWWAKENDVPLKIFTEGVMDYKNQVYTRYDCMADYAEGLIAIWKNKSKDTEYIIKLMKKMKKPIVVLKV